MFIESEPTNRIVPGEAEGESRTAEGKNSAAVQGQFEVLENVDRVEDPDIEVFASTCVLPMFQDVFARLDRGNQTTLVALHQLPDEVLLELATQEAAHPKMGTIGVHRTADKIAALAMYTGLPRYDALAERIHAIQNQSSPDSSLPEAS